MSGFAWRRRTTALTSTTGASGSQGLRSKEELLRKLLKELVLAACRPSPSPASEVAPGVEISEIDPRRRLAMAAGDCVPFVLVGFVVLGGSSGFVGVEVKSSWTNKLDAVVAAVTL